MPALQHIVFARDFSPCSDAALPYAVSLAKQTGATLHVFHADTLHSLPGNLPSDMPASQGERLRTRLRQEFEGEGAGTFNPGSVPVRYELARDVAAAPAILRYAYDHDASLVVMGTHGRRGLRRALLGSVAEEVVRLAPCPVLTVRLGTREPQEQLFQRIMVPVDFSSHSNDAVRTGRRLAARYGARLTLLHVVEDVPQAPPPYALSFSIFDQHPDAEERSADHMRELYERVARKDPLEKGPASINFVTQPGQPARDIVRYAEGQDMDLIVMATHGLTGFEHMLMGSVAERVVRAAPCPVYTLKALDRQQLKEHVEEELKREPNPAADTEPPVAA